MNTLNTYRMSPLHYVTTPSLVGFFLDRGANDVAVDKLKRTPITAARDGNLMGVFNEYLRLNTERDRLRTRRLETAKYKRANALSKAEEQRAREDMKWMKQREAKFKKKMQQVSIYFQQIIVK